MLKVRDPLEAGIFSAVNGFHFLTQPIIAAIHRLNFDMTSILYDLITVKKNVKSQVIYI